MIKFEAHCPICDERRTFVAANDYEGGRNSRSDECPLNGAGACAARERALALAFFSTYDRANVVDLSVHEAAPANRGISAWLRSHCKNYVGTGYFPDKPFGDVIGTLRNEDLEKQTFADEVFDAVIHLDVMEHLFNPLGALKECARTLRPNGRCFFTTPTYQGREKSAQVAFREDGKVRIVGTPEYHGNPQDPTGSLVTWRYGYDLPVLIKRETGMDVEVRRWQSMAFGVFGVMNDVYIATKLPT